MAGDLERRVADLEKRLERASGLMARTVASYDRDAGRLDRLEIQIQHLGVNLAHTHAATLKLSSQLQLLRQDVPERPVERREGINDE